METRRVVYILCGSMATALVGIAIVQALSAAVASALALTGSTLLLAGAAWGAAFRER
jgi:hypothetical protein